MEKQMTVDGNLAEISKAVLTNCITLKCAGQPDDDELKRVGFELIAMLHDRARLLPSYWEASGDESAAAVAALDKMAALTKMLYYSIRFEETVSVAMELGATPPKEIFSDAKANHTWLNAFHVINPTTALAMDLGAIVYRYRDYETNLAPATESKRQRRIVVASANAS